MTVPSVVVAAARTHMATAPTRLVPCRVVRRGDLRLIVSPHNSPAETRLALIVNVDTALRFAEIALVHPYTELATSTDGVVPGVLAGTPFDVVVQTDLRGIVWAPGQVSRLVGRMSADIIDTISDLTETVKPAAADGIRNGVPLTGPTDRRWAFKASEGAALDAFTADCVSAVIDRQRPVGILRGR